MDITDFIWNIADQCLRGYYKRAKFADVILPMTVIRRLDTVLEDTKGKVLKKKDALDKAGINNQWNALCKVAGQAFCNDSPFTLKGLLKSITKQNLRQNFEAYLDGFSPNVQEILDKFKFRDQIDTLLDPDPEEPKTELLSPLIKKFVSSDINLGPNPVYKDAEHKELLHEGLDNHGMGTIFEELIRRFNEDNNEKAGEHWTPRDVVELMADLIFVPVANKIKDATYSLYDGACGTGGMLTVAQTRLQALAEEHGKAVSIHLFGQEVNPETYAVCKADMLLKGDGKQAENICFGNTLSSDKLAFDQHTGERKRFDFMLSNPPYGKHWRNEAEDMGGKENISDPRFKASIQGCEEKISMLPRLNDGQLLFLLNNVSKMKDTSLGSRIAEVHNGSSLFTGDAGSGESNTRRYVIENDLVEAIIAVPNNMFYNTGIGTYIWILSNRKEEKRKGKIQLIDATAMKSTLIKNMGHKNCEFTPDLRKEILRIFVSMEESEVSKVFENKEFAYWSITVERPLRLRVFPEREIPKDLLKKANEKEAYEKAIKNLPQGTPLDDWTAFAKATKLTATILKKVRPFITEKDPSAKPIAGEPDADLRDTDAVPFFYEGGIDAFMKNEVLPYAPDAWEDQKKRTIGYEISFTKYFYKPAELRDAGEILAELAALERESIKIMAGIVGRSNDEL